MEKLPQRPAIIDSLQRCTQLGTFTNKGRPINISHADRAGDSGRQSEGVSEGGKEGGCEGGGEKIKRLNRVTSCFVWFLSLVLFFFLLLSSRIAPLFLAN